MGPPTNVDGETTPGSREQALALTLQWGRRQTSTERSIAVEVVS